MVKHKKKKGDDWLNFILSLKDLIYNIKIIMHIYINMYYTLDDQEYYTYAYLHELNLKL